jgi:hypothetical protein
MGRFHPGLEFFSYYCLLVHRAVAALSVGRLGTFLPSSAWLSVLPQLSGPSCPVIAVMFWLFGPLCPVRADKAGRLVSTHGSRLSCPGYPVPAVLSAVLSQLSSPSCPVPGCTVLCCHVLVLAIPSSLPYPICTVSSLLNGSPVPTVMSWLSCPSCLVFLSRFSCPWQSCLSCLCCLA